MGNFILNFSDIFSIQNYFIDIFKKRAKKLLKLKSYMKKAFKNYNISSKRCFLHLVKFSSVHNYNILSYDENYSLIFSKTYVNLVIFLKYFVYSTR
jgi:hypothetical protein